MAFPIDLTNAVDGVTEVVADHLNNLEAKVGVDNSQVTNSLDYLLKNPASDNPGHTHSTYQDAGDYITDLAGDVAASGPGSVQAAIQPGVVTLAKMANLAANSLVGNNTGSPATPLALSVAQVKTLLALTQSDVTGLKTTDSPVFAAVVATGAATGNGTNPLASNLYIQSRGLNLITNGSGLLQNNYNFSSFTFDQFDTYGGKGSFRNSTYAATVQNDEFIPIDGSRYYKLGIWAKATTYAAGAHAYLGIALYDVSGLGIDPNHYMRIAGTDTTLAQDLNVGDTVIHLTDSSNWLVNDANAYKRQMLVFNWTNSYGYTYPAYTYSRRSTFVVDSDYRTNGVWAIGGISGNDITLTKPWPASLGNVLAGTAVSNSTSGNSYKYIAGSSVNIPNAWTNYSGYIGGWDTTGSGSANLFPYGTANIRLLFMLNRDVAGNVTNISNVWFGELTGRNIEAASATQPGAVVLADQQMGTGEKYFASSVGIGNTNPNDAAMLHITSTTKGFLPPVMTEAQKNAIISPPEGLIVYDSTNHKLCVRTNTGWQTITSA